MKLMWMALKNFGSFHGESARIELEDRGLVSIVGRNEIDLGEDANGAGKSTILDGLLWGLFGETGPRRETSGSASGLKTDDVVNEAAGKHCLVTVAFEGDDGCPYRVERWRKGREGYPAKNGVVLSQFFGDDVRTESGDGWGIVADVDKANVQSAVEHFLGLDYSLASRVLVRSQEDQLNFAESTPKERFGILTQIEGVGELDDAEAKARVRGQELVDAVNRVQADRNAQAQSLELYRSESFEDQIAEWEEVRTKRADSSRSGLADEVGRRAVKAKELEGRAALEEQHAALAAQLSSMTPPEAPGGLADWRKHGSDLRGQLARVEAEHGMAVTRIGEIQNRGPGVCGDCGQSVSPAHIEQRRGVLESEAGTLQDRVIKLRAEIVDADRVIQEADDSVRAHHAELNAAREAVVAKSATVAQALRSMVAVDAELKDTRTVDRLTSDVAAIDAETNPHINRQAEVDARCVELAAKIAELDVELVKLRTDAKLMEWWIRHIPSLKSWIFDSVVGEITAEANRWLTHMMGGSCWVEITSTSTTKTGASRDKIGLKCFRWKPDGSFSERPYRRWSGGEKRRISLAIDWALASRLAQRAHASCSFLALDEVDRRLDPAGREGLLSALDALRAEKETVLIISHDPEIQAAAPTQWVVTKDENGSRLEEVKCGIQD